MELQDKSALYCCLPVLNTTYSLSNAQVGDCSTRLRLGFPAIWSIRDPSNVVGKIWSIKSVNDSGYFERSCSKALPFRTFSGWQQCHIMWPEFNVISANL